MNDAMTDRAKAALAGLKAQLNDEAMDADVILSLLAQLRTVVEAHGKSIEDLKMIVSENEKLLEVNQQAKVELETQNAGLLAEVLSLSETLKDNAEALERAEEAKVAIQSRFTAANESAQQQIVDLTAELSTERSAFAAAMVENQASMSDIIDQIEQATKASADAQADLNAAAQVEAIN